MIPLQNRIPAFALPFVTRSLRGGRGRRYLALSLVLTMLTALVGLWVAYGRGEFEHEVRVELGLEESLHMREMKELTVFARDEWQWEMLQDELQQARSMSLAEAAQRERNGAPFVGQLWFVANDARHLLESVATYQGQLPPELARLREQARELIGPKYVDALVASGTQTYYSFPQFTELERQRLESIIAKQGVPTIERYSSPAGPREVVMLMGIFAGGLLILLMTVFAPLLVAVQQAQERNENTLQPLTGTALSPRELVVGLASGPLSIIAIFAVPLLVVFLLAALTVANVGLALVMLIAMAATSVGLVFGSQMLGQLVGRKRTPGMLGIGLMMLVSVIWMIGLGFAADASRGTEGVGAVLPHTGIATLLSEAFTATIAPAPTFPDAPYMAYVADLDRILLSTVLGSIGAAVLGILALTALTRQLEGREGPLLTSGQALLGAITCVVMVNVAIPSEDLALRSDDPMRHFVGLAMLALPFALLLMARVPIGDLPPKLQRIRVVRLLAEFAAWGAIHIVGSALLSGSLDGLHPVSLAWLGWCIAVLGLLAIRVVATPGRIAGHVWAGFCAMSLALAFGQSVYWGVERSPDVEEVFVLMELSPVLGLIQIALTVWIPISLVRHLRQNLGRLD